MRTETKAINIYKFDELSDRAKEKAFSRLADINVEHDWWGSAYAEAEWVGLKITSFNTYRLDITGRFIDSAESCAHAILDEHGPECDTYKTATAYLANRDELIDTWPKDEDGEFEDVRELDGKLDELDEEFLKSILEDYLSDLRKEYEYLTSEESIRETIEANGYEFTEDGSIY